jgi:copper chaperone
VHHKAVQHKEVSVSICTDYVVTGMTCEHCVRAVTEEVRGVTGVEEVTVDLATGRLRVASETAVPFPAIEAAVDEAGYTVVAV